MRRMKAQNKIITRININPEDYENHRVFEFKPGLYAVHQIINKKIDPDGMIGFHFPNSSIINITMEELNSYITPGFLDGYQPYLYYDNSEGDFEVPYFDICPEHETGKVGNIQWVMNVTEDIAYIRRDEEL